MGVCSAEEHAIRHNHCAAPAQSQEIENQPNEQKLTLRGDWFIASTRETAAGWG